MQLTLLLPFAFACLKRIQVCLPRKQESEKRFPLSAACLPNTE
jgi:hypothetical protein